MSQFLQGRLQYHQSEITALDFGQSVLGKAQGPGFGVLEQP